MKRHGYLSLLLALVLCLSALTAAHGAPQDIDVYSGDPIVFEVVGFVQQGEIYVPPQDDVVGKAIEARTRFRVEIKEMYYERQGNWTDEFNLFQASQTWPDLLVFPTSGIDTAARFADNFLDVEQYVTDPLASPNMHNHFDEKTIGNMTTLDGRYYYWPLGVSVPDLSDPSIREEYPEVFYNQTTTGYYISAREDILTELGYTFTPVADLLAKVENTGERLTLDELALDPPINTMEDLEELLRKIKDAGFTNDSGLPVIPFGGGDSCFSFGGSFGFCFFRKIEDGTVHCFYGNPHSKEMFRMFNKWVREGLMDKDIYMLKNDQLQAKIISGQVALWNNSWLGEELAVRDGVKANCNTDVRLIPNPIYKEEIKRGCDDSFPGAGQGLLINKNFGQVDELFAYLDWLYSDEAQELVVWGDGQGTLWHIEDGRKVFNDYEFYQKAILVDRGKTDAGIDANYYGVKSTSPYTILFNRNWDLMNKNSYRYSYPEKLDPWTELRRVAGSVMRDYTSEQMTSVPHGEYAGRANNFFWAQGSEYNPKIILAEDDEAFEAAWETTYEAFMEAAEDYEQMQIDMAPFIGQD